MKIKVYTNANTLFLLFAENRKLSMNRVAFYFRYF